jgi:hypothetical protein
MAKDIESDEILGAYTKSITLKAKEKILYASITGAIADWAEETLKLQKYKDLPLLEIKPSDVKNMRCKLYAELIFENQKFGTESRRTFMVYKRM